MVYKISKSHKRDKQKENQMTKDDIYITTHIVEYMQKNCVGRDNAKPRETIRTELYKCYGIQLGDRAFRKIYAEIPFENLLVSHHNYGYFMAKDEADLNLFKEEMDSKLSGMMNRKRKITDEYYKKYGDQLGLGV